MQNLTAQTSVIAGLGMRTREGRILEFSKAFGKSFRLLTWFASHISNSSLLLV